METSSENLKIKVIYEFIAMSTQSKKHPDQSTTQINWIRHLFSYKTDDLFLHFQTVFTVDCGISDRGKFRLKINSTSSNVIHMSTDIYSISYYAFNKYSITKYPHSWPFAYNVPKLNVHPLVYPFPSLLPESYRTSWI